MVVVVVVVLMMAAMIIMHGCGLMAMVVVAMVVVVVAMVAVALMVVHGGCGGRIGGDGLRRPMGNKSVNLDDISSGPKTYGIISARLSTIRFC